MYDESGNIVTSVYSSVKTVYQIIVARSIPAASTNLISVSKSGTASKITVLLPKNNQLSVKPMGGAFQIHCFMPDGTDNYTADIWPIHGLSTVLSRIIAACPYYLDKIDLSEGNSFSNYDDGRDFLIRFTYVNKDIPQWEIVSSPSNMTLGNEVFFKPTTWIPYSSQNLFYEPVPYEFLYTAETAPQVIVSVDGVEAACDSLNCSFKYIQSPSVITDYSLVDGTLTINGTGFTNDIVSITLENIDCKSIQYHDDTKITCTILPVACSAKPIVIT
jgi:hypothetical protein